MAERRRSFVLLAVLLVMGAAILVVTMLVHFAGAEAAVATASSERARARALAFSGVQIVLSELDLERDRILDGRPVLIDSQYVIHESETELGVVRLIPPGSGGDLLQPVGGLLDLNLASAEQLVTTGLFDELSADAIVSARNGRPDRRFRTLEDLLEVTGPDGGVVVTPEQLLGDLEEFTPSRDVLSTELDRGERALEAIGGRSELTIRDVLTVHSFEPALQRSGVLRINLNVPYSEELGERLDDRFGEGASRGFEQIMKRVSFDDEKRIVDVLMALRRPADEWGRALDSLTSDERWHVGRIDINTAPAEVIRTLDGVDADLADAIVRERDSLTSDERATRTWPFVRELMEGEDFGVIAGRISTRCWVWKTRIAAGLVSVDDPDGPIRSPVILDLVIDLAAPVPRIAALRDISGLEVGVRLLQTRLDDPDPPGGATGSADTEAAPFFEFMAEGEDDDAFFDSFETAFSGSDQGFSETESPFEDRDATESESGDPDAGDPSGGASPAGGPRGRWSPR